MHNNLLYKYLEYALAHNIISTVEFFFALWEKIKGGDESLLSSSKFPMFIKIIEIFFPSFRYRMSKNKK